MTQPPRPPSNAGASGNPAPGDRRTLEDALRWFAQHPEGPAAREEVFRLAADLGAWQALADTLEAVLERGGLARALSLELREHLTGLYANDLHQPVKAREGLEALYRLEPENPARIANLSRHLTGAGAFRELAELKVRHALGRFEGAARVPLLLEAARFIEQHLPSTDAAADVYRQILDVQPDEPTAVVRLEQMLLQAHRHGDLADFYASRLLHAGGSGSSEDALRVSVKLARLHLNRLENPGTALDLLAAAHVRAPQHPEVLAALEELALSTSAVRRQALALLAPSLPGPEGARKLIALMELQLGRTPLAEERSALLLAISALAWERLDDSAAAFFASARALRESPGSVELLGPTVEWARKAEAWEELEALLEETLPLTPNLPARQATLHALAALHRERQDEEAAAACWLRVLEASPEDGLALEALEGFYTAGGRLREHIELLERQLNHVESPERQVHLLQQIADLCERAGDTEGAVASLRAAFALNPSASVLEPLERLLARAGRAAEQAEVLARLAAFAPPGEGLDFLLRRAELLERAGGWEAALQAVEALLDPARSQPRVLAVLERLLEHPEARARAAQLLEGAYRRQNNLPKLVVLLEAQLPRMEGERHTRMLRETARLWEALEALPRAFELFLLAFEAAPEDPSVREALDRLARRMGGERALASHYERALARGVPAELAPELWQEVGALLEGITGESEAAVHAFEEVARREPSRREPLVALARIHRRSGDGAALARVLERHATLTSDEAALTALWSELGALALGDGKDPALAIRALQKRLELTPHDTSLLEPLDRLLAEAGRTFELVPVLERRVRDAQSTRDAAHLSELELRLGWLLVDTVGDAAGALALFQRVLGRQPSYPGLPSALEDLASSEAVPPEVRAEAITALLPLLEDAEPLRRIQILEKQAQLTPWGEDRARRYLHVAQTWSDLGEPARAFLSAAHALRSDPLDVEALERAEAYARGSEMEEELTALLMELVPRCPAGARQAELGRVLARTQELLGERDEAFRTWQVVAWAHDFDAEAVSSTDRLAADLGKEDEGILFLEESLACATTPAERAVVQSRLGLAHEKAGRFELAADYLEKARTSGADAETYRGLARVLERLGRLEAQAEVLGALAHAELSVTDVQQRQVMLQRVSVLIRLGQVASAVEALAALQARWPELPEVVELLVQLFRREPSVRVRAADLLEPTCRGPGDVRLRIEVLTALASRDEGEALFTRLEELANLQESCGEALPAWETRVALFRAFPGRDTARRELARLARSLSGLSGYARELEAQADAGPEPWRLELLRELASLRVNELGQLPGGIDAWETVLERAPRDPLAMETLAGLYRRTGSTLQLAKILREQLPGEPQAPRKVTMLEELAGLAAGSLEKPAWLLEASDALLELQPDHPKALAWKSAALILLGRLDEARGVLQLRAQREPAEAVRLKVQLAELEAAAPPGEPRALALLSEALAAAPMDAGAVALLQRLLQSPSDAALQAATLLEPVYQAQEDHDGLVDVLELRAARAAPGPARAALLRQVSELQAGPLWNARGAFDAAARALRELPGDAAALELCVRQVEAAMQEASFVALLATLGAEATDPEVQLSLLRARARVQQVGDPAGAASAWEDILRRAPECDEARAALHGLLRALERWPELLEVLEGMLERSTGTDARVQQLAEKAELLASRLGRPRDAILACRALLELAPDDGPTLARLDGLLVAESDWTALEPVLELRCAREPASAPALGRRLAHLRETRLDNLAGARTLYGELLAASPADEDLLGWFEARVKAEPQDVEAWEILLRALRALLDAARLGRALEERAAHAPTPAERKRLQLERGALWERQSDPLVAFEALGAALAEDPADAELRGRLVALAATADVWPRLLQVLEKSFVPGTGGALEADPRLSRSAAGDICLLLARVYEAQLRNVDKAVLWYQRASGFSSALLLPALKAQETLFRHHGQHEALASTLEALSAVAETKDARLELLFEISTLAMAPLRQPDRAAAALLAMLDLQPGERRALERLEGLYEAGGQFRQLEGVLARHALQERGVTREALQLRRLDILVHPLDAPEAALEVARVILRENPRSEGAFTRAEALLSGLRRPLELVALLEERLARSLDPKEVVRLHERLGALLRNDLHRPAEAVVHFQAVLEREPRSLQALEALRALFEEVERRGELSEVLERLIALRQDPAEAKADRIRWAEVLESLGELERSLDVGRKALATLPHLPDELERLRQLFVALQSFPDVAAALNARAAREYAQGEVAQAIGTLFDELSVWESHGAAARGAQALEKILELDPLQVRAYRAGEALYAGLGAWTAYAHLVRRWLVRLPEDPDRLGTLRSLARVEEQELGVPREAFQSLRQALTLAPSDRSLRADALRLATHTSLEKELAASLEEVAEGQRRGTLARELYFELATLQDGPLNDASAAERALRKVLDFEPDNLQAHDRLASMFRRRGMDRSYVQAVEQQLECAKTVDLRQQLLRALAEVLDGRLSDLPAATVALQRSFELVPDIKTGEALLDLHARQAQWTAAVDVLMSLTGLSKEPVDKAARLEAVGELQESRLLNDEAALAAYHQALAFHPASARALAALERLYLRLDRPSELRPLYAQQLAAETQAAGRVAVQLKLALLLERRFSDLAGADAALERALELEPGHAEALRHLVRLRRMQGSGPGLIDALERQVATLHDPGERAEVRVQQGRVWRETLQDRAAAAASFRQALELYPRCRAALQALAGLALDQQDWTAAAGFYQREVEVSTNEEGAEVLFALGKLQEEHLAQTASAVASYERARRLDPRHLASLRALRSIHEKAQDWEAFEHTLRDEADLRRSPEERCAMLVQLGAHLAVRRGDVAGAVEAYELARAADPESLEAARPLADLRLAREEWSQALRALETITGHLQAQLNAKRDRGLARELATELCRLGRAARHGGEVDRALKAFERAAQVDSVHTEALEGKGELLASTGRRQEALKVYQDLLLLRSDGPSVVEVRARLGDLHLGLGQTEAARQQFERALAMNPVHERALRALIQLHEDAEQREPGLALRKRLVQTLKGEAEFLACVELGKLARDQGDLVSAMDAYVDALEVKPRALDVLEALFEVYTEARRSQKAAEVLARIVELPQVAEVPARRHALLLKLGDLWGFELRDVERALAAFDAALDGDPAFTPALVSLEKLLGHHRRWPLLEQAYLRSLKRCEARPDLASLRAELYRKLGELQLDVLQKPNAARESFRLAAEAAPRDAALQQRAGELAAQVPGQEHQAIEALRRALPGAVQVAPVTRLLLQLLERSQQAGRAALAASVLGTFAPPSDPAERAWLEKLARAGKAPEGVRPPIAPAQWPLLLNPKVRGPVGRVMTLLFRAMGERLELGAGTYGLSPRKHRVELAAEAAPWVQSVHEATRRFGMEKVELFSAFLPARRDSAKSKRTPKPLADAELGAEPCFTWPLSLRLGGKFFEEAGAPERQAMLGHALAGVRPELVLARTLPTPRLIQLLEAAVSLHAKSFPFSTPPGPLQKERRLLERSLAPAARSQLALIVRAYLEQALPHPMEGQAANDILDYVLGAELSCLRAALVACGDGAPLKVLFAEGELSGGVPAALRIRELIEFSFTPELASLELERGATSAA